MANNFVFHSKLDGELDKMVAAKAATGFFGDGGMVAKFTGTKTVLIDDVEMDGLGDYDRESGFPKGAVKINQSSYELAMERGTTFTIDRLDAEEAGLDNLPARLSGKAGEFVRTQVVPEVDAYALSKLYSIAADNNQLIGEGVELENHSVAILTEAINAVGEAYSEDEDLIAFVDPTFYADLMSTDELTRRIDISDFSKGEVSTKVKSFNDCPIIRVPAARMKSEYTYNDGSDKFGFAPAEGAKNVGCIVLPRKVVNRVMKTQKMRFWTPDQNIDLDAYKLDFRFVYDFLVKKSALNTVYAYAY